MDSQLMVSALLIEMVNKCVTKVFSPSITVQVFDTFWVSVLLHPGFILLVAVES